MVHGFMMYTERATHKSDQQRKQAVWPNGKALSPFLTGRIFVRRTMIHFLTELLVRRIWFGQSKLYFVLNWLVMRCKLRPELAADTQQTA